MFPIQPYLFLGITLDRSAVEMTPTVVVEERNACVVLFFGPACVCLFQQLENVALTRTFFSRPGFLDILPEKPIHLVGAIRSSIFMF